MAIKDDFTTREHQEISKASELPNNVGADWNSKSQAIFNNQNIAGSEQAAKSLPSLDLVDSKNSLLAVSPYEERLRKLIFDSWRGGVMWS